MARPSTPMLPVVVAALALAGCAAAGPSTPISSTPVGSPSDAQTSQTGYQRPVGPVDDWATTLVAAKDRTAEDRRTDARRKPAEFLTFLAVRPGMKVADLGAGGGYTTELLARAVGPRGRVFGQNNAYTVERYVRQAWSGRLASPTNGGVVRLDREYGDPLPAEATGLDLVTIVFSYHDMLAQGTEFEGFNAAVLASLRPGGEFVVVDHDAPAGSGVEVAAKTHRISAAVVRAQVEAAGFEFVASADFLRSPEQDGSFVPGAGGDRFVLKFRRPQPR